MKDFGMRQMVRKECDVHGVVLIAGRMHCACESR